MQVFTLESKRYKYMLKLVYVKMLNELILNRKYFSA